MAHPHPRPHPRSSTSPLLERVADLLHGSPCDGPTVAGIVTGDDPDDPAGVVVHLAPVTGDLVVDLAGVRAPEHWAAFGFTGPGRLYGPDAGLDERDLDLGDADPRGACAWPVRTTFVVDRRGASASRVRGLGPGVAAPSGPPEGRVPDACRRVLGLPTAPATQPTAVLWALDWLDRALSVTLACDLGERPPTWRALGRLDRGRCEHLAPWAILRRECAAGLLDVPGVCPVGAEWMDDGMFAREVLGSYLSCDDMLGDLRALLRPGTYRRLVTTLVARAGEGWCGCAGQGLEPGPWLA